MPPEQLILFAIVVAINLASFALMVVDKRRSMQGSDANRIPEGVLFFAAAAFGSGGIYLAMFLLRHKTRKWYFQLGIPLLILQNLVTLYVLREMLV